MRVVQVIRTSVVSDPECIRDMENRSREKKNEFSTRQYEKDPWICSYCMSISLCFDTLHIGY